MVTFYTRQDLSGDVAGYVEMHSPHAPGQTVFVQWDDWYVAYANEERLKEAV